MAHADYIRADGTLDILCCGRCLGRGVLGEYLHHMSGVCFKCYGVGQIVVLNGERVRLADEARRLVREAREAKLDAKIAADEASFRAANPEADLTNADDFFALLMHMAS